MIFDLFTETSVMTKVQHIQAIHQEGMASLNASVPGIQHSRVMGAIAALDMAALSTAYGSNIGKTLARRFLQAGLLLRPLGNVLYLMPPYIITEEELLTAYVKIKSILLALMQQQ